MRVLWAALVLAVAAAGWQSWRAERAIGRAQRAEAIVSAYAEAVEIRRRSDQQLAGIAASARQLDDYLSQREGGDAPLSDYLSDAAQRVWGQAAGRD